MLNPTEQLLLLFRLPDTGTATYWKLQEQFADLNAAFDMPAHKLAPVLSEEAREVLAQYQAEGTASPVYLQVQRDLEWAQANRVHLIDINHDHYPQLLRETRKSPPLLYVAGDPHVLSFPQVAIVGTRNPTPAGRGNAFEFGAELARSGFTVTSGLALGVDTCAHRGAVSVCGRTIAVLGTGIDTIYPQRNASLANEILANGGALVSEFPLGTSPLGQNFPQRNRIISGMSYGVLVVEAAVKSGSLITARYALQQDREVFAIPGSIHNPMSRGCHALIKDGAKLVETAGDIVDELKSFLALKWEQLDLEDPADVSRVTPDVKPTELEDAVFSQLGHEPTKIDTLVDRTRLSVGDVMACLLTLELKGLIANTGTGYMRMPASKSRTTLSF